MGLLKSIIYTFLVFAVVALVFPAKTLKAESSFFAIDSVGEYKFQSDGKTHVVFTLTLENLYTDFYATNYEFSFENIDIKNVVAKEHGVSLPVSELGNTEKKTLTVNFLTPLAGIGKKRNFTLEFDTTSLSTKTGEVTEISIPRPENLDSFRDYTVSLTIPTLFGNRAYISPKPVLETDLGQAKLLHFDKVALEKGTISAGFGNFQVFAFDLSYHLENPLGKSATTEIVFPPDTAFQSVSFESIEPAPESLYEDRDGNWIGVYTMKPRARLDIKAKGSVQVYASPKSNFETSQATLSNNLLPRDYWDTGNPEIVKLAKELKTPENIYNFVASSLTYDYQRVKPNVRRLGAVEALKNPKSAICMEFTDLFITLARAAGIPAREVNGYAYTENKDIYPISLVADVLHAWPEYYDFEKKVWIPVDPTWGATSKLDYFSKLDLRHVTFVIHGSDSTRPYAPGSYKLGVNPQKDVFVTIGEPPKPTSLKPKVDIHVGGSIPFVATPVNITIKNTGATALYDTIFDVFFDNEIVKSQTVKKLLPYATVQINLAVPGSILATNWPSVITVGKGSFVQSIATNKIFAIAINLLAFFAIIAVLVILALFKFWKGKRNARKSSKV